ncbi:MAG: hypothetical protein DI551_06615 [Micavibrio aeruginosavorus]|uniref:Uncharacterized protein n=1 Tax=Micavibrio aeruginosavorus TaxID=349221 RepID=A0A2W5N4S0_9BACT|nr:MAG: hypothetical protein DI551_06615 [Micavibrio aeruginosavorus]
MSENVVPLSHFRQAAEYDEDSQLGRIIDTLKIPNTNIGTLWAVHAAFQLSKPETDIPTSTAQKRNKTAANTVLDAIKDSFTLYQTHKQDFLSHQNDIDYQALELALILQPHMDTIKKNLYVRKPGLPPKFEIDDRSLQTAVAYWDDVLQICCETNFSLRGHPRESLMIAHIWSHQILKDVQRELREDGAHSLEDLRKLSLDLIEPIIALADEGTTLGATLVEKAYKTQDIIEQKRDRLCPPTRHKPDLKPVSP